MMDWPRTGVAGLLFGLISGCTAAPPTLSTRPAPPVSNSCLLPAEQPMLIAELFLGRGIRGRAPLSDAEWAEFAAHTITPNFPDGFTVFDGEGQWRNPRTGQIARQRTKILLVAARPVPDLAGHLAAVIDAYKMRFHQQSVGLITREVCAAF